MRYFTFVIISFKIIEQIIDFSTEIFEIYYAKEKETYRNIFSL